MNLSDKNVVGFEEKMNDKFVRLTHDEYHDKKAKTCGCGFDCCEKVIHTEDHTTHERYVIYISNGQLIHEPYSEYLATGADEPTPPCTYITSIEDNAIGVSVTPTLTWVASTGATGYRITIGTSSGGHQVCNLLDMGTALTAIPGTTVGIAELSNETEYFIKVTPYNASGNTTTCREVSFTTIAGN